MNPVEELRIILRERELPFFEEGDILYYLNRNGGSVSKAAYDLLIIKSESTTIELSGLTVPDTSAYFRRLASRYTPNHSGILK